MTDKTSDNENALPSRGGAGSTPLVGLKASVRVSGPDYVIEAGDTGKIDRKHAEAHVSDGHGTIVEGK